MSGHECPANGCTRNVPQVQLACRTHWYKVSAATRRWVNDAYRHGTPDEHREAMAKAISEMNGEHSDRYAGGRGDTGSATASALWTGGSLFLLAGALLWVGWRGLVLVLIAYVWVSVGTMLNSQKVDRMIDDAIGRKS